MKKTYILFCAILIILLVGCSNKTERSNGNTYFDKVKSELVLIPKEYRPDNAVKDGCFVVLHGELKSDLEIMDKFLSDSQKGKKASITIVQYTTEGDPIITKVIYNGEKYYGIEDNTRDKFGSPEYRKFEFQYLKLFDEKNIRLYLLFNDNKITYSDYMRSMTSSNSKDWIDHKFLCSY